jgi:hypothetical protein
MKIMFGTYPQYMKMRYVERCILLVDASNDAARKYYEETAKADRTVSGVTAVMRATAKAKQQSFKGQFSTFTAVANPKFGDEFLQEVSDFSLRFTHFPITSIVET